MYVADVTSKQELQELLRESKARLRDNPNNEQAKWDIEDIEGRMSELGF